MIRIIPETGSTNSDLAAQLRSGHAVHEGHWLVADRQLAGRGRQGRAWFDGRGNFMGSTLVRLHSSDPSPPTLALVAGLALYEAVAPALADPSPLRLKWPNDLMLGPAKLAGILLEREGDAIIIGIGVNLAAAPEISGRRTIAMSALGPAPDRDTFARALATSFAAELGRWRTFGVDPIIRRWESIAHAIGTPLKVGSPEEPETSGTFAGLSDSGALSLRLADGTIRVIHAGEVMLAIKES